MQDVEILVMPQGYISQCPDLNRSECSHFPNIKWAFYLNGHLSLNDLKFWSVCFICFFFFKLGSSAAAIVLKKRLDWETILPLSALINQMFLLWFYTGKQLWVYFTIIIAGFCITSTKWAYDVMSSVSQRAQLVMISTDLCRKSWNSRMSLLKHPAR